MRQATVGLQRPLQMKPYGALSDTAVGAADRCTAQA